MMSEDKLEDKLLLPGTASEPEDGLPAKGLEIKEKRLRKSLKNAVGALRDDLAKIRKESDSSILTRMGVGGSKETAKRGTSTVTPNNVTRPEIVNRGLETELSIKRLI